MIADVGELELAAWLRAEVIKSLGGIKDASVIMRFNDPSPNWMTTNRLSEILAAYEAKLCALGAVPVVLHGDCGRDAHYEKAVASYGSQGHWRYVLADGQTDADLARGGIIHLDDRPMTTDRNQAMANQCLATHSCPCGPLRKKNPHQMAEYFLWPDTADTRLGDLCALSNSLRDAIAASADRRRRSGIREHLLMILMGLERLIQERIVEDVLEERGIASR